MKHLFLKWRLISSILLLCISFLNADESQSVFKLAERFYNDSLYNLALEQYQKFLSLKRDHGNDPTSYYKSAYCKHKMDNNREAAEGIEEYIRLFPNETNIMEAMFLAGTLRQKIGDFREASDWFFSVWSRFVGSAKARMALFKAAQCAEADKNIERAVELYALYYNRFPKTENAKQASLSLSKLYIDRKEYTAAEAVLDKTEKQWKKDKKFMVRLYYYKASLAKKMQKIGSAEEKFRTMAGKDTYGFPEREQAYKEYIDVLVIQKKFGPAHDVFKKLAQIYTEKSIRFPGTFIKAWADNGRRAHLFDEAIASYQKLINEYQDEVNIFQVRYRLAQCLVGKGDFPKAIENLRSLELHDSTGEYAVRAVLKIGELYYDKGLYPSAIAAYRRYLQLPDRKDKDRILYRIGKTFQEKYKRFGSALREFENLLKLYPASQYYQRAVYSMAQCQEALKEYKSAVRNYEYISEVGGDNALVEKAKQRAVYIRTFLIKDAETAAYKLTELVQIDQASVTPFERLITTATIFSDYLKDYSKALDLFGEIEKLDPQTDSLLAGIKIKKAHIYRKLHEKALCENNPKMATYFKEMAVKQYKEIIVDFGGLSFADEAAYSVMMMTSPNISDYEAFITKYQSSRYLADVYMNIARHYEKRSAAVDRKFSKKAVGAYGEIVSRFPGSQYASPALLGLARNHLILDALDSTEKTISLFVERYPNSVYDAEVYYIQGILAKKKNKYTEAADIFKEVLYRYPFSNFAERSRYELALSERKTGKIFESLSNYRLYLQNYSDGAYALQSRYGVAKCLFQLDNRSEAIENFKKLLEEKLPEDILADIHYELARIAQEEAEIYDALDHYKAVLSVRNFPHRLEVLRRMGTIYFDNRIYDDATSSFEKALEFAKNEADSVALSTSHISSMIMDGKRKKADKRIKKFKDHYGDRHKNSIAEIIYYEGTYLLVEKDYEKAVNRFRYILQKHEQSDRCDDASYQVALAMYYQNKMDEALDLFYKFPIEYPGSEFVPLAYFKIGMIFHGQNDFVRAAENFSKVLSQKSVDSKTRFRAANNAAVAYQKTSSWLDAARMHSLILTDYKDQIHQSSYHLKAGFCLIQASQIEEAFEHFKKAKIDPKKEDKPEILYWIGTCYAKLGDHLKAIAEYLKVPYLYSGIAKWGVTAEFEAARLYERLGEYTKAITLYRKIVNSDGERGRFGKKALIRIQRLNTLAGDKK